MTPVTSAWRWPWGLRLGPQRAFSAFLLLLSVLLLTHDSGYPHGQWLLAGLGIAGVVASGANLVRLLLRPGVVRRAADGNSVLVYEDRGAK